MLKFIVGAAKNLQEGAGCCALFATYYIRKAGRVTRKVGVGGRSRAGLAPPLRGGGFLIALFSRWVAMHGRLQRAAYTPPLRTNPLYSLNIKSRAGLRILYAAALPCCYRRHNLPGIAGDGGCYLQHNSRRWGCYRQHSLGVVIHGTVWFCGAGVVIPDTIQNRCYSRHISAFCAKNRVVIGGTIAFGVVILGTIRQGC